LGQGELPAFERDLRQECAEQQPRPIPAAERASGRLKAES
jgi:hypothetical protein